MSDEKKVYEVFTDGGELQRTDMVRVWPTRAMNGARITPDPVRCALIPIGDGLLPGTRVRDVEGRTCAVVGPAQVDGIAVPASAFTVVQYHDLEVESIGTASLTPIPDEPRTYTLDQVRKALGNSSEQHIDLVLARLREVER